MTTTRSTRAQGDGNFGRAFREARECSGLDEDELSQGIETTEISLSQAHHRILVEVLDPADKAWPHMLQSWVKWLQSCSGIPGDTVAAATGPRDLVVINVLKELTHFRQATVEGEDHGVKGSR